MNCPDCNFLITDDDIVDHITGKGGEEYECEPYYKCPKCKCQWEV
jgi:hypothetical protein